MFLLKIKIIKILLAVCVLSVAGNTEDNSVKYGKYEIDTKLMWNEKVVVYYAVPMKNGFPSEGASNIVFCAPYVGEREFFKREFNNYFVKKLGFTVFSFEFKYDENRSIASGRENWYYYKESGWHDLVFKVQDMLLRDFQLTRKKLLIAGESGGGSMAQQMGVYFPEKVEAVASIGGAAFDEPKEASNVAWLMINTWGASENRKNDDYQTDCRAIGMQVLRSRTPPVWKDKRERDFRHCPGPEAEELAFIFLKAIVELRDTNEGVLPVKEKWPIARDINGIKYYFPSEEFFNKWNSLPNSVIKSMSDDSSADKNTYVFNEGADNICVVLHDPGFESTIDMDETYYISALGNTVVTTLLSDECGDDRIKIAEILEYAIALAQKQKKKIRLFGMLNSGYLLLEEAANYNNGIIEKVVVVNPSIPECSEKKDIKSITVKVNTEIYLSGTFIKQETSWQGPRTLVRIEKTTNDFGNNWFKFLKKVFSLKEEKSDDEDVVAITDNDKNLSTSQVDDIDRNLKAIERFLVKKEYEIAEKMFEKLTAKYSSGNMVYVNPGTYKWIVKKMKENKE